MISGKQGSGKTTLANELTNQLQERKYKVVRMKFADVLYELHDTIFGILKSYGITYDKVKHGPLLQYLGTDFGRKTFGENVWAGILRNRISGIESLVDFCIVDDLRFKNEFETFPEAFKIRLSAPEGVRKERCESWREDTNHPSEVDLDEWEMRFDSICLTHFDQYTPSLIATSFIKDFEESGWLNQ